MVSKRSGESPATGILLKNDWGDSKFYKVVCECGQPDHDHDVWVEAEDTGVSVYIYATVKTNFWSVTRWKHIWKLLVNGYVEEQVTISMNEKQTVNYANALLSAVQDVKTFKDKK